jgi:hypothetical protein
MRRSLRIALIHWWCWSQRSSSKQYPFFSSGLADSAWPVFRQNSLHTNTRNTDHNSNLPSHESVPGPLGFHHCC